MRSTVTNPFAVRRFALVAAVALALPSLPVFASESISSAQTEEIRTYADLADLADHAPIVVRGEVQKASRLKPAQAGNVRAGYARVYIEAKTRALLVGSGIGESIRYLADVKLSPEGKLPKLRKAQVIVFANPVPGRPGELRLVAPDAQLAATPEMESRVRALLAELVAADAAPRVTGVREAMHVAGNLAGEGETQLFLSTERGDPVSISVMHRPGMAPQWGVSLSEIVDQAAQAPARNTLLWYRLACSLPADLPRDAILSGSAADRQRAVADYRLVISGLGPCDRTRTNT